MSKILVEKVLNNKKLHELDRATPLSLTQPSEEKDRTPNPKQP